MNLNRRNWFFKSGLGLATGVLAVPGTQAASATTASVTTPVVGMLVEAVQLPAWHIKNGRRLPLAPGDRLATGEELETASGAGVVVQLAEGSLIRLGEKTRLGIQRLEVNTADDRTAVQSELKLFNGFFRFTTSAVAKVAGTRKIDVSLRTATVGIRGTDFWTMTDDKHDATCLFEGKVDLATRDQGALTLDKPTAFWARFFDQPVKPVGNATPDELAKFIKTTELQPGQGVAVVGGRWRVVAAAAKSYSVAKRLEARLREQGYPAQVKAKQVAGAIVHEVRINGLVSMEDAQAVLSRMVAIEGVNGHIALSA